ncbi:DUF3300 domain-containing protein [Chitinibacter fontanus]|uniref:DUF3300 domain-containing protein n=2 Tax=Chitinibacter fontanus TaxID=1737446 RepID=A0A7D5VCE5_9NEIS|nr:DUF3300 domain-containing protein [Chitinibacter fontanus]
MQSLFVSAALLGSPGLLLSSNVLAAETAASNVFSQQEIEQLVAPIALYPDALLAQVLMASTYPLEVVQAARWRKANSSLKDKALEDALLKQPWDASVKSLAAFPDVLAMLNDKIDWTQKLGDAFLAQQKDVMDATQRLRAKAKAEGNLKDSKEQKVIVESTPTTVIRIEPQTEVVYVPVYNPTVVYGPWPYPSYVPYYWYPPSYAYAASAFSFTVGVMVGAALWGDCDWHHGHVNINVNHYNSFNRTTINNTNWTHNVDHRRGVEYRDKTTREQYRPQTNHREQSREAFRGKADQTRADLGTIDRADMQGQLKDLDRAELSQQLQNKAAAKPEHRDNQSNGSAKSGKKAKPVANPIAPSATHRDSAFSQPDHSQLARSARDRGASSQRSVSRPVRVSGHGK